MNYTTGTPVNDCVCKEPCVGNTVKPSLNEQIAYLMGKTDKLAEAFNSFSYFLTGEGINEDRPDDKTITAYLAYVIRRMDAIDNKVESMMVFFR